MFYGISNQEENYNETGLNKISWAATYFNNIISIFGLNLHTILPAGNKSVESLRDWMRFAKNYCRESHTF
jgi:hypothetical protein